MAMLFENDSRMLACKADGNRYLVEEQVYAFERDANQPTTLTKTYAHTNLRCQLCNSIVHKIMPNHKIVE